MDGDPYGLDILSIYRFGSLVKNHKSWAHVFKGCNNNLQIYARLFFYDVFDCTSN